MFMKALVYPLWRERTQPVVQELFLQIGSGDVWVVVRFR